MRASARRSRAPVFAGASVLAMLAITTATAFPPRARSQAPAPTVPQLPATYAGATAATPQPKAEADPGAQRFTGKVGPDLSQSLLTAGVPAAQGHDYVALLARAIPLAGGLSVEDRFDLIVEREPDGSLGQLLYAGLDRVARADVQLMKWTDGKHVIWVNADGIGGESSQGLKLPVNGRVTSGFGERYHPILGYTRMHEGVDLGAAAGTPIVAAADGRVVAAGWRGGYGRQVAILHGGGMETTYSHMSAIAARPGEAVQRGEVIGYVGQSGLATGPHLHFEVLKDGRHVNPLTAHLASGPAQLEGETRQRFDGQLRTLLLLPASG